MVVDRVKNVCYYKLAQSVQGSQHHLVDNIRHCIREVSPLRSSDEKGTINKKVLLFIIRSNLYSAISMVVHSKR